MPNTDILPINFTLADAARNEIIRLMGIPHERLGLPALPSISWAVDLYEDGTRREGPAIGFYDAATAKDMRDAVQIVNGVEVVYFVTESTSRHFYRRTLDFAADRGFFLRS